MDEDPTTREHRVRQAEREQEERRQAEQAASEDESEQHDRRAEKADYLKKKLEERAESERED
jgi:hypothetical protein